MVNTQTYRLIVALYLPFGAPYGYFFVTPRYSLMLPFVTPLLPRRYPIVTPFTQTLSILAKNDNDFKKHFREG